MTVLTQAITEALFHSIWQGVLVAALLWMMLFLLRSRSANARYLAGCAALFGLFAIFLITVGMVYEKPGPLDPEGSAILWIPSAPAVAWLATAEEWAFPLWAVGVVLFSMRLMWGIGEVSAWRSKGTPGDEALSGIVSSLAERMGIRRHVTVLISSLAEAPGMIGWLRPVLLVPVATVSGLTPQQLEAILAHELAHIRRHDYLVNIGQMVVETLLFYHPAIWWASSQIRRERELACDDLAVKSVGDALSYARALMALEKTRVLAPDLAMGSTRGPMLHRIQRLISPQRREHGPSKLAGVTVLVLLSVTCLFLSMNWASAQVTKTITQPRAAAPAVRQTPPRATEAVQAATEFLQTALAKAEAAVDRAEDRIRAYSRSKGVLFIEEGRNSEIARLTALQNALTAAQIEGIQKDAVARVTEEEVERGNMATSNAALVELRREEAGLALSYPSEMPVRQRVRAQIEIVEKELKNEAVAAIQRAHAERRIAAVKEAMLKEQVLEQRSRVNEAAEELIQYQILQREHQATRQRYDALRERLLEAQLERTR
jgi:beta-lactamase regulating signal transducer with metallopeptidase domain